jgi:predicted Ser/Thr protein kinase
MVANQYVTQYQANLLARGHADCFFLNEYKILDRLGKGRMAGVYKAVHRLGQVVAIKILPPSKARDPQSLARFQRESSLAIRLKHPNIVRTFQTGEANGLHFLVMEHLEGETLADIFRRRGPLPPEYAGVKRVVEAAFAHRRKTLPNSLELAGVADRAAAAQALETVGRNAATRAEALAPAEFVALAAALR